MHTNDFIDQIQVSSTKIQGLCHSQILSSKEGAYSRNHEPSLSQAQDLADLSETKYLMSLGISPSKFLGRRSMDSFAMLCFHLGGGRGVLREVLRYTHLTVPVPYSGHQL